MTATTHHALAFDDARKVAINLGASLYTPCTRKDLIDVASGKIAGLRSVIFCLEDSVREEEVEHALFNLENTLRAMPAKSNVLRFVRIRNVETGQRVLNMTGCEHLDGLVIPKFDNTCIDEYMGIMQSPKIRWLMPTLETEEVFNNAKMIQLRDSILEKGLGPKILSFRVGGNDLMHLLGVRRSRVRTLYESPIATTLASLCAIFKPTGFNLTSPVFELLDQRELLNQEVPRDLEHGFFGKTAIHPDQIPYIEAHYRVFHDDLQAALKIVDIDAPAVFRFGGAMCEPATHWRWAQNTIDRAEVYGVMGK